MLLWGAALGVPARPCPQTGGVWARQGGESPLRGLSDMELCTTGCSDGLGGRAAHSTGAGREFLLPKKGLEGDMLCAACSSMTNGTIRAEA